jgi:hypothetical protein
MGTRLRHEWVPGGFGVLGGLTADSAVLGCIPVSAIAGLAVRARLNVAHLKISMRGIPRIEITKHKPDFSVRIRCIAAEYRER